MNVKADMLWVIPPARQPQSSADAGLAVQRAARPRRRRLANAFRFSVRSHIPATNRPSPAMTPAKSSVTAAWCSGSDPVRIAGAIRRLPSLWRAPSTPCRPSRWTGCRLSTLSSRQSASPSPCRPGQGASGRRPSFGASTTTGPATGPPPSWKDRNDILAERGSGARSRRFVWLWLLLITLGEDWACAHQPAHVKFRLPQTPHLTVTVSDPILARLKAFDQKKGGGAAYRSRGGYMLVLTAADTPVVRLKPGNPGRRVPGPVLVLLEPMERCRGHGRASASVRRSSWSHLRNRGILDLIRFRTKSSKRTQKSVSSTKSRLDQRHLTGAIRASMHNSTALSNAYPCIGIPC